MKKALLILYLILYSFFCFAQQTIINDTLKPFGSITVNIESVVGSDSNYYLAGELIKSNRQSAFIIKTDLNGNVVGKNVLYDSLYEYSLYPYNSLIKNNNELIFCCQAWDTNINVYGKIISIDANTLDTIWTTLITHPDTIAALQSGADIFSDLTAIKPTPDGGYILTGNYNKNCVTGDLRSFLLKIDSVGNVEWRKTYNDITYVFNIEVVPWGGYTVYNSFGGRNVVYFDSNGNEIWRKATNNSGGIGATVDLSYAGQNLYTGATTFKYTNSDGYDVYGLYIFKLDFITKQFIWEKTYKPINNFFSISLHEQLGVEVLNNGDIIVIGNAWKTTNSEGFIFKLNSNGDSLWTKFYNYGPQGDNDCQINDLLVTDNNELLGVGFYAPNSSNMAAWIFKTDSNGVLNTPKLPEALEGSGITIFPNPASDFINIEIDKPNLKLSYYKIFDSQGKMVLSNDFVSNRINIKSFSTGIYFIECVGEGGGVFRGKFVKD